MPLYRFGIRDDDYFEDDEGIELPDDLTAQAHGMGTIHELQKADQATWRDIMEVCADGQLDWQIPFEVSQPSLNAGCSVRRRHPQPQNLTTPRR
jgi:hypothetical protein